MTAGGAHMKNEYSVPDCIRRAIKDAGYEPDTSMAEQVAKWWAWYTAADSWYDKTDTYNGRKFHTKRATLHPARRVCREWASIILDDDGTKITLQDAAEGQQELLDQWVAETQFIPNAQRCLERAFATGTGALALWFDVEPTETIIKARRYDCRMVLPLSWDDDGITECAFCTTANIDGKRVDQLQMHVVEEGTYHIITRLFHNGMAYSVDSVLPDFDTRTDRRTFAILRPAIDNVYADGTYLGQSVFADALDAVKGVDNAYDSMQREIDATKVKVFMSDELLDVVDENGKPVPVPMSPENTIIRKLATTGMSEMLEIFAPDIRMDPLVSALNVSLAELGDQTGFGANYFRYDKDGGMKTAREVSSDNSAFARTVKKHENELRPQLEGLLGCMFDCLAIHNGSAPIDAQVAVDFDDSIISDTEAEKNMMMAEVGAGVAPAWEYRQKFRGEDEDTARMMVADARGTSTVVDETMIGTME